MTTDANEHYLRQHEAQEEERERRFDNANAHRKTLVMAELEKADRNDLVELVSDALYADPQLRTALVKIIKRTRPTVDIGQWLNNELLVQEAAHIGCVLFRRACDLWGDDLVAKAAEEVDDDQPCKCGEECKC